MFRMGKRSFFIVSISGTLRMSTATADFLVGVRQLKPCCGKGLSQEPSVKLTKLEANPFHLSMRQAVKFATGQLIALEHVLVRV